MKTRQEVEEYLNRTGESKDAGLLRMLGFLLLDIRDLLEKQNAPVPITKNSLKYSAEDLFNI